MRESWRECVVCQHAMSRQILLSTFCSTVAEGTSSRRLQLVHIKVSIAIFDLYLKWIMAAFALRVETHSPRHDTCTKNVTVICILNTNHVLSKFQSVTGKLCFQPTTPPLPRTLWVATHPLHFQSSSVVSVAIFFQWPISTLALSPVILLVGLLRLPGH